jgi:hypothetical protein
MKTGIKLYRTCLFLLTFLSFTIYGSSSIAARSDVEDFVTRFYQLCLGRDPDQNPVCDIVEQYSWIRYRSEDGKEFDYEKHKNCNVNSKLTITLSY